MRCLFLFALASTVCVAAELQLPSDVVLDRGVDYTSIPHGKIAMDIVRPKGAGKYPGVIPIHGGGFNAGSRESYLPMAIKLAQHGYVAAAVDYRLTPIAQFPSPLYDVKAAVRFLRAHAAKYSLDKDHMAAIGNFRRRHLGAVPRRHPEYAPVRRHWRQSGRVERRGLRHRLLRPLRYAPRLRRQPQCRDGAPPLPGGDREHALDAHFRGSPLNWITPDSAPILAIHGTRDQNVPFEQSVWLVERMRGMGVEAELETLAEAGHGFKGADDERAFALTLNFLNRKTKPILLETRRPMVNDHGPAGEILCVAWPSGRVLWRRTNHRGTELAVLPNGNVLYIENPKSLVTEIDPQQQVVWQYQTENASIMSIQRLDNGNTLLVDDSKPRLFEVAPDGKVVWSVEKPEYKGKSMRRARRTAAGTTLVAIQDAGLLLEINRAGDVLHQYEFPNRMPALAKPTSDGGMPIGLAGPGEVRRGATRARSHPGLSSALANSFPVVLG